jgi:hypothetical protein
VAKNRGIIQEAAAIGDVDRLVMHGKGIKRLVVKNDETLLHTERAGTTWPPNGPFSAWQGTFPASRVASKPPSVQTTSARRKCMLVAGGPTCGEIYVTHTDLPDCDNIADIKFNQTLSVDGVHGSIADILAERFVPCRLMSESHCALSCLELYTCGTRMVSCTKESRP